MELMVFRNSSPLTEQSTASLNQFTRKKLPIAVDFQLKILNDSQKHGILVTVTILFLLVILANSASFVVNFKRSIRPVFRTCLISLACSDILTSGFVFISYATQMSSDFPAVWYLGDILCSFIPFLTTTAILVNSLTLVSIAFDRYIAIANVMKGTWNPSALFCVSCAVIIWGLAAGIASPMLTSYYLLDFYIVITDALDHTVQVDVILATTCICDKTSNKYFFTVVFVLIFLPMVLTFIWLNSIIAKEIWNRRRPLTAKNYQCTTTLSEETSNDKPTCETQTSARNDENKKSPKAVQLNFGNHSGITGIQLPTALTSTNTTANTSVTLTQLKLSEKKVIKRKMVKTCREARQLRMFTAILLLMSIFLICRMPTWVFLLYKLHFPATSNLSWMLNYIFGLLSMMNCVLNPLLYTFLTETMQFSFRFVARVQRLFRRTSGLFEKSNKKNNFLEDACPAGHSDLVKPKSNVEKN